MNNVTGTPPNLLWPLPGMVITALALLLLAVPVWADQGHEPGRPDLSDYQNLEVPPGNSLAFHVYAEGVQVYQWDGASWRFVAPEAFLYADSREHRVVGIHYAGPTWESRSGSRVVGAVLERATPDPDSIPWLLLRTVSSVGPGIFHRVTYIQRLATVGGKAPSFPGAFPGAVARVPYTAEYFFYR